jgi:hypothetical protein
MIEIIHADFGLVGLVLSVCASGRTPLQLPVVQRMCILHFRTKFGNTSRHRRNEADVEVSGGDGEQLNAVEARVVVLSPRRSDRDGLEDNAVGSSAGRKET